MLAVPLVAVEKVSLVTLPLAINSKNPEQATYSENQFEIYLKEDFMQLYLRPDYETQFSQ